MDIRVGIVTHYYSRISVAVVELSAELKLGIRSLSGHTTEFTQTVESMEIEHHKIIQRSGAGNCPKGLGCCPKGGSGYKVVE